MIKKQSFYLFWGVALALLLSSFHFVALSGVKDAALVKYGGIEFFSSSIALLKMMLVPLLFGTTAIVIAFSWHGKLRRFFTLFFSFNTAVLGLYTVLFFTQSDLLSSPLVISIFYLYTSVSLLLPGYFIWGLANQRYSLKLAAAQYPILGLLASGGTALAASSFSSWNTPGPFHFAISTGSAAFTSLLLLFVTRTLAREEAEEEAEAGSRMRYWGALALLVFSVKIATYFPEVAHKFQLKSSYPVVSDYMEFMKAFSISKALLSVYVGLSGVALGAFIYVRGERALSWVLGLLTAGIFCSGLATLVRSQQTYPSLDELSTYTTAFEFALMGALIGLLALLQQFAYFAIERKYRFTVKIAIDVAAYGIASGVASLSVMAALNWVGQLSNLGGFFFVAFVLVMLGAGIGVYGIHKHSRLAQKCE